MKSVYVCRCIITYIVLLEPFSMQCTGWIKITLWSNYVIGEHFVYMLKVRIVLCCAASAWRPAVHWSKTQTRAWSEVRCIGWGVPSSSCLPVILFSSKVHFLFDSLYFVTCIRKNILYSWRINIELFCNFLHKVFFSNVIFYSDVLCLYCSYLRHR